MWFYSKILFFIAIIFSVISCQIVPQDSPDDGSGISGDSTPPVVSIDDLFDGQNVATSITVYGSASDNVGLEGVYLSVDADNFSKVDGVSNWQTNLILPLGNRKLKVFSKDSSGLASSVVSINLQVTDTPDVIKPIISIDSPDGVKPVGNSFTAYGKAQDDIALEGVYISLDGASFSKIGNETNWSHLLNINSTGIHQLKLFARDQAGNKSTTNECYFLVNPAIPTVSLMNYSNYQIIGQRTINLSGQAADEYAVEGVYLRVLPGSFVKANGATNWNVDVSLPALSGWYTLEYYSKDSNANQSPTEELNLLLDIISPVVSITAPVEGQLLINNYFTLYGKALDNAGALENTSVYLSINGLSPKKIPVDSGGNWFTNIYLANNTYNASVYALDSVGNISIISQVNFIMKQDNELPEAVATNITDGLALDSPFFIAGTASDDSEVVEVDVIIDSIETIVAGGTTAWQTTNLALNEGGHQIQVFAKDSYGKIGTTNSYNIIIDKVPPTIEFGMGDLFLCKDLNQLAIGSAYDAFKVKTVYLSTDGIIYRKTDGSFNQNSVMWFSNITLSPDMNIIKAYAVDVAGNCSVTNQKNICVDLEKPVVTVNSPLVLLTKDSDILLSVRISDNYSYQYFYYFRDTESQTLVSEATNACILSNWQTNLVLAEGENRFNLYAIDAAGNIGDTNILSITLDTTPPVLSGILPADGDTIATSYTMRGEASDAVGIDGIYVSVDGAAFINIGNMSDWSYDLETEAGAHTIKVFAEDMVGNSSTTNNISITVE